MITKDDVVKDLTHWKAGNGHAFVGWCQEEGYCRVAPYLQNDFPRRVFLASVNHLSPTKLSGSQVMLPVDALSEIQKLQHALECGEKALKDTHVVNVKDLA